MKSPALNGFNRRTITPPAKFARDFSIARDSAKPTEPTRATKEVTSIPISPATTKIKIPIINAYNNAFRNLLSVVSTPAFSIVRSAIVRTFLINFKPISKMSNATRRFTPVSNTQLIACSIIFSNISFSPKFFSICRHSLVPDGS